MTTQRIVDDFNRPNSGSLGANWTTMTGDATITIAANEAIGGTLSTNHSATWTGAGWPDLVDQYAEVIVGSAVSGSSDGGICLRAAGSVRTYYLNDLDPSGGGGFFKRIAGALTLLSPAVSALAVGDVLRMDAQGTTLRSFRNGVAQHTFTDAAIDGTTVGSTKPGLFLYEDVTAGISMTAFAAGDFNDAVVVPPASRRQFPKFRLRGAV